MGLEVNYTIVVLILSGVSLLANIWVSYVCFSFKELQKHPSKLLSWISLFEISMSQHSIELLIKTNLSVKGYGPHNLIQLLSLNSIDSSIAKSIACAVNQMLYTGAVTGVLCYNAFLSVDLIITLRNPLIVGKARMKYYHSVAWILIVLNMGYNLSQNIKSSECNMDAIGYLDQIWNYGSLILVYIFLILSTMVCVHIYCKNISEINTYTRLYLKKHIIYILIVAIGWTFCVAFYWAIRAKIFTGADDMKPYLIIISLILVSGSGALQALLRTWDSAFWTCSKTVFSKKKNRVSIQSLICSPDVKDDKNSEDIWNIPISFLIQENLKFNTTLCILSGIYETIKKADFAYNVDFNPFDEAKIIKKHKILFSGVQSNILKSQNSPCSYFTTEEYSPVIFNRLRVLERITKENFLNSLNPEKNQKSIASLQLDKGGSGSAFIFTDDNSFAIKILKKSESIFLIENLLVHYLDHIEKNCMSLLNRIFGLYRIKIPGLAPLDVILTECLIKGDIDKYYDLKGSKHNRNAQTVDYLNFKGPFKDIDFIAENFRIRLEKIDNDEIRENILKDFNLLLNHGIMDYSLIFVVLKSQSHKGFYDSGLDKWYRFGIIDFLGEYSFSRKAEYYLKKIKHGKNIKMCSVMKPLRYYQRILDFVFCNLLSYR